MTKKSKALNDLSVTLHSAATTLPAPSADPVAGASGDVTGFRRGGFAPRSVLVSFFKAAGTADVTVDDVQIVVWDAADAQWRNHGAVLSAQITLTAAVGQQFVLRDLGSPDHIQVVGTVAGGTGPAVTVKAKPIEETD